ncbi:MAG: ECF transporter S component [candidate division Zixibacteria bacterium]|nr:ECF transporter S component [candidate division Zixibacteria bacterium]
MTFSAKKIAKMGVLTALPIVLKIPIFQIPNVEFFSFVVFTAGFLLGAIEGAIVGTLSMTIYTIVNPYGPPPIPVGIAQVVSMALIGISGGILFHLIYLRRIEKINITIMAVMGTAGFLLTLVYDILTNLGVVVVAGEFVPVMIAGIPFALLHLLSNTIIFMVLSPVIFRLAKLEKRGEFA